MMKIIAETWFVVGKITEKSGSNSEMLIKKGEVEVEVKVEVKAEVEVEVENFGFWISNFGFQMSDF